MTWRKITFFWFSAVLGGGFPALAIAFYSKVYPTIAYIVHKQIRVPIEEYTRIGKENDFFRMELKRYKEKGGNGDGCHLCARNNSNSSY